MRVRADPEQTRAYRDQLLAEVLDHAETEGQENFLEEAFADLILDDLEQEGHWPDYQLAYHSSRGAGLHAWALDQDRRILYLALCDFDRASAAVTLPATEINRLVARLHGFLARALGRRLEVEEHNPVFDLLEVLSTPRVFDEVQLHVLSNRVAGDGDPFPVDNGAGPPVVARVWDLETIRRIRQTGQRLEAIDIDLSSRYSLTLPFLEHTRIAEVRTLLLFMPAPVLADLYQTHGGRLLERNVRAFLSARGGVNRGIRDTLRNEPERFLAYNNGLTATAASVRISSGTIHGINDLQIVNGGQTTASIAAAARDGQPGLENVAVQMKLVVVGEALLDEMVPNISRYANRQNAVQESDLSANHEYLRRLQEASRTEWTPVQATGRSTKWYLERARGSYAVDHAAAGPVSAQKRFTTEYPRIQKFSKNDIAVFENTWSRLPHLVSRGGQKNFVEFMTRLPEPPTGTEDAIDAWHRERFRDLVAKAIAFRSADHVIAENLGGTYKRAVVAYTLSYLLERAAGAPDLNLIWRTQQVEQRLTDAVLEVAGPLKEALIDTAMGRNITEWAKHENCWITLRDHEFVHEPIADRVSTASTPRPPSFPGAPGLTLADAIERVHGERIEGPYRRYRRRQWRHLGDTGVAGTFGSTLTAYSALLSGPDGEPYVFNVVVDFPARTILPLDRLDPGRHGAVVAWLHRCGYPL